VGDLWHQFQVVIFNALLYLYGITHDWGMAIILLTLMIRVVLLPLTWKQTKSMVEMQRIQPLMKAIQEKYKDDKEKQQEETLKLYSEHKVNPLGGCLPLLLQFPVLIALYGVLGQRVVKGQVKYGLMMQYLADHNQIGTFYRMIPDIAKTPKDMWVAASITHNYWAFVPYILLLLLFGVSIWLPQALMPGDPQQKNIGAVMAVMMLVFGWSVPAGVLLYWDVSSIWGVAQQQITMSVSKRELAQREEEAKSAKAQAKASAKAKSGEGALAEGVAEKKPANKSPKKKR
jgi:YidC/Oxa1 family membrane protein insertase